MVSDSSAEPGQFGTHDVRAGIIAKEIAFAFQVSHKAIRRAFIEAGLLRNLAQLQSSGGSVQRLQNSQDLSDHTDWCRLRFTCPDHGKSAPSVESSPPRPRNPPVSARRLRQGALRHSSSNDRSVFQYLKRRFLILNFTMQLDRSLSVLDRNRCRQGQRSYIPWLARFSSWA